MGELDYYKVTIGNIIFILTFKMLSLQTINRFYNASILFKNVFK